MKGMIRAALMGSLLASVACGATTREPATPTASAPASTAPSGPTEVNASEYGVIPVGQEIDVRMQNALSSETATVEQRFQATTAVDLMQNNQVLVPAGTVVHGVVSAVDPAGRIDRSGSLTLSFDRMSVRGRELDLRASATQVFESGGIREEVGTAGVGAGIGGVIGGLLGGVKGAIVGVIVGAGGAIAATDGKDVEIPAGAIVRLRFDTPVRVR
jgi:hypothetical protein